MSYFDTLITELQPPETFDVEIRAGMVISFRSVRGYAEWLEIMEKSTHFLKVCKSKQYKAEWAEFLPLPDKVLSEVYLLDKLCVTEGIGVPDWFKLARDLGGVFLGVVQMVNAQSAVRAEIQDKEEVELGKDDSPPTSGDGTS